jgi:hypothetical protein
VLLRWMEERRCSGNLPRGLVARQHVGNHTAEACSGLACSGLGGKQVGQVHARAVVTCALLQ